MKTSSRDPVCGMDVDKATAVRTTHDRITFFFCSEKCRQQFERDPDEFAGAPDGERKRGHGEKTRQEGRGTKFWDYIPLIVVVVLTLLSACAKQYAYAGGW